jgi:hypothetical protein
MWLKSFTTLSPNKYPAPLVFNLQVDTFYGSDHIKSAIGPSWGISMFLLSTLIWSIVLSYGDNPPWTQNISPKLLLNYYQW